MTIRAFWLSALTLAALLCAPAPRAQDKPDQKQEGEAQGPPPAVVVVDETRMGRIAPDAEFVGTLYFVRQADVAAEVGGKVAERFFDEGDRLEVGAPLLRLDDSLLRASLENLQALLEQSQVERRDAETELERQRRLFEEKVSGKSNYDNALYAYQALTSKVSAQRALVERTEIELEKMRVAMPFEGVVLERHAEVGEWINAGGTLAVVADTALVDLRANVPQELLLHLEVGQAVPLRINERRLEGRIHSIIPRGDTLSRTFPIRVRLEGVEGLAEGMEARLRLPVAPARETLTVHRDAVVPQRGQDTVWQVGPGDTALPVPVEVVGYEGLRCGVQAEGLEPGARVVVKGQERLRPGQPLQIRQATAQ